MTQWFRRDASWYANPECRSVKKLHLMGHDDRALCSSRIVLNESHPYEEPQRKSAKCKKCLRVKVIIDESTGERTLEPVNKPAEGKP